MCGQATIEHVMNIDSPHLSDALFGNYMQQKLTQQFTKKSSDRSPLGSNLPVFLIQNTQGHEEGPGSPNLYPFQKLNFFQVHSISNSRSQKKKKKKKRVNNKEH